MNQEIEKCLQSLKKFLDGDLETACHYVAQTLHSYTQKEYAFVKDEVWERDSEDVFRGMRN